MIAEHSLNLVPRRWQSRVRLVWLLLAVLSVGLFIIGTVSTLNTPLPRCTGPDADCPASVQVSQEDVEQVEALGFPLPLLPVSMVFSLAARLSLALIGAIIFWKRSDEWMALILSVALISVLQEGLQNLDPALLGFQTLLFAVGTALFLPIPFIFPTGHVVPRWLKWPMVAVTALYTVTVIFILDSPVYWTFVTILNLLWVVFGSYAMVYRYQRVSTAVERQQTKWVLLGILAVFIVGTYYTTINSIYPAAEPSRERIIAMLINLPLYVGGYISLAISLLVAMLRYRLWDIDVLIRRTLQYALLTGLLALIYFGGVIVLQGVLGPLMGDTNSPLVTVITTLGIAALFTPLRTRVQEVIDRRFFRKKYDAERSLAQFSAAARDEVDLERLSGTLIEVVDGTMQPVKASLWLAGPGKKRTG